jgi:ADP-heptose:LPS heptosyltransferase
VEQPDLVSALANATTILETDLGEAAWRLSGATLYVGNDGGMTHVAAAIGVPTLALFGPTDPAVWRPLGDHVRGVATERPGDPIEDVSLATVTAAVRGIVQCSDAARRD